MNFTKTTEYAFRILSFMAADENRLYSVDDIFKQLHIPYRYLRKLMTNLSKSDFLVSVQGKRGGYKISKDLAEINLFDIISIVDPEYLSGKCFFGFDNCALQPVCVMHDQWNGIRQNVRTMLAGTSLADIKLGNNQDQILTILSNSLKT